MCGRAIWENIQLEGWPNNRKGQNRTLRAEYFPKFPDHSKCNNRSIIGLNCSPLKQMKKHNKNDQQIFLEIHRKQANSSDITKTGHKILSGSFKIKMSSRQIQN